MDVITYVKVEELFKDVIGVIAVILVMGNNVYVVL